MKPTIIIDQNIPFIKGVLEPVAEVTYLPAVEMTAQTVRHAHALIVRTRTQCNAGLLHGSSVRFIATATIGFDHIDTIYCKNHGISWQNAPGCNAASVGQYMGSAWTYWSEKEQRPLQGLTLGIVGVGHVGREVEKMARRLGMNILRNDPIRAEKEGPQDFVSLQQICEQADIITFHTPLTVIGDYPTFYLADEPFFQSLRKKPLIINAARGGVVNETALLEALDQGYVSQCIIDCWENEPNINFDLMMRALIATPHIAGYSADGKANATMQSVRAVSQFFQLGIDDFVVDQLPPMQTMEVERRALPTKLLETYDITRDSRALKQAVKSFEQLRSHYPIRREINWILK